MLFTRKGNLIINGDFESGEIGCPPDDWVSQNVLIVGCEEAFTGSQAALLGSDEPAEPAFMYQDIEVCPLRRYSLSFQTGTFDGPGGPITVQVRWMDTLGVDMGIGLHVLVKGGNAPNIARGFWEAHVNVTDFAPLRAKSARIIFTRGAVQPFSCPTALDAVTLTDIR